MLYAYIVKFSEQDYHYYYYLLKAYSPVGKDVLHEGQIKYTEIETQDCSIAAHEVDDRLKIFTQDSDSQISEQTFIVQEVLVFVVQVHKTSNPFGPKPGLALQQITGKKETHFCFQ